MFVLDTNTVIYFFKGSGKVAATMFSKPPGHIGIPAITLYELELDIAKSTSSRKRMQQLDELVSAVQVLPFSSIEAKTSADIRADLEKKGTPIGPL